LSVTIKGTLHDKNIRPFIEHLAKKYPVNVKITYEFLDVRAFESHGRICNGLADSNNPTMCNIKIASRDFENYFDRTHGFTVVLSTIAHEYFHVLQRYQYGLKPSKPNDPKFERPAGLFGWAEARAAVAEGIVEFT